MRSYLVNHLRSIYSANYRNKWFSPLRFLYTSIVGLRYEWWGKKAKGVDVAVGIPVIVVGNLTMGGAGKTPVVIALVEWLRSRGFGVAVISRGYGAQIPVKMPRIVDEDSSALEVGDEPLFIYQKTGVLVVVCPDRHLAALQVTAENRKLDVINKNAAIINSDVDVRNKRVNVILSDDGLQHYRLRRVIEIVVVDLLRGFGNGLCLPEGPLREPLTRLKTVDVVLNASNMKTQALYVYPILQPEQRLTWSEFRQKIADRSVHAIAGIANPEKFFQTLEAEHLSFTRHPFPDHHPFTLEDFAFLSTNDILLMTEKDKVKCLPLFHRQCQLQALPQLPPEWWCVELQIQIQSTTLDHLMTLLNQV